MIKIIKEGTRKQETCNKCGCVFSYEAEDVNVVQLLKFGYKKCVACPQCKNEIVVSQTR